MAAGTIMIDTVKPFESTLKETGLWPLTATGITAVQINLGTLCNLSCRHCHVEAGPYSTKLMSRETMQMCLDALGKGGYTTVDITGGAPEMNPHYRWFIKECREICPHVKTRTNLTILLEDGYEDIVDIWREYSIEVIASLPHYLEGPADRVRGNGVFSASIEVLRRLNTMGYGIEGTGLVLNIVVNPTGAFLPPSQRALEEDFRRNLKERYNISFNNLFTLTNMPVGRFLKFLEGSENLKGYIERLASAYNSAAASNVMCRQILSIGWDGSLYDCDFNQMLGLKCNHGAPDHLRDFDPSKLNTRRIVTGLHCYGCTAGSGSSCSGEVAGG